LISMDHVLTQPWPECAIKPMKVPRAVKLESIRRLGTVLTTTEYIGGVGWINHLAYEGANPHFAHIDQALLMLISAVSAHSNACRYCYGAVRASLQIMGYDDDTITELQGDIQASNFEPAIKTVLEFTRLMVIADPQYKTYLPRLAQAGYSNIAIAEIAYFIAVSAASHRINTPLAIPADRLERFAGADWARFIKPIVGSVMRWKSRPKPATQPLTDAQMEGPFSSIVSELNGSPAAAEFRAIIDKALASEFTDAAIKGFIYAIIARTLDAGYVEREAVKMLYRAGVEADVITAVLDHLRHPSLSEDDLQIINYARDSVRYQVPAIQKSLRQLSQGMQQEHVVDIVGQAAFANTVARMSVLVD
jgi:alkylhydroperoxidase family enzyme